MHGDPNRASIAEDADVYISWDLSAPIPAEGQDFAEPWGYVGLLDGDAGTEQERNQDSTDYFAWGQKLIRTSRRNFVLTEKFVALEKNAITNRLIWPGSTPTKLIIPKHEPFKMALVYYDGDVREVLVTSRHAMVDTVGTIGRKETELTKYEITAKIYPDASGALYDLPESRDTATRVLVSISSSPASKTAVKVGTIEPSLTVTATYSDGSTVNVTNRATFTSSAPAKATVDRGFVTGVAVGTANVTVSYGGQNATVPVTVVAA
jgi:hypothetical protein